MSNFSRVLNGIVASRFSGRQADLIKKCGLHPSCLSRYLYKDQHPTRKILARFCGGLEYVDVQRLTAAFFMDTCPSEAQRFIRVIEIEESTMAEKKDSQPQLGLLRKGTLKSIDFISRLAIENEEARQALESTYEFLRRA